MINGLNRVKNGCYFLSRVQSQHMEIRVGIRVGLRD